MVFKKISIAMVCFSIPVLVHFGCSNSPVRPVALHEHASTTEARTTVAYGQAYEVSADPCMPVPPYAVGCTPVGDNFIIYQYDFYNILWFQFPYPNPGAAIKIAGGLFYSNNQQSFALWTIQSDYSIKRWNSNDWTYLTGQAREIATNLYDQSQSYATFIIGCNQIGSNYGVYKFNGTDWDMFTGNGMGTYQASGIKIAVDNNLYPWVIQADYSIHRWNGSTWNTLTGQAREISADGNGNVFIIGCNVKGSDYGIYKFNGTNWSMFPSVRNRAYGVRISVDYQGYPWIVKADKSIWHWNGGSWDQK
jgi:hypothetical protein